MDDAPNPLAGIRTATVLKPGDRVLLVVDSAWSEAHVHRVLDKLKEGAPEVRFLMVCGVGEVVIKPAEEATE